MAARFFQRSGAGLSANIGLTVINDLSFEHERGFRVGLLAMSANIGTVRAVELALCRMIGFSGDGSTSDQSQELDIPSTGMQS
ncbi:uncharacterized protein N7477_004028 [Penicillium maclennaniae]|uniref:uncharacterized protein n=1 Tax=Penicillium maclennaniae TaxID=1343394 RepID=UPI002542691A|nr:uncharacterized protein N7477_004028 [Penicillium maclennaniae]KAJ5678395.1 hypothetical protein N7477_004028 [Penicillium maclennaniae]